MQQRGVLALSVLAGCALLWAFSGNTFVVPTPGLRGAQQADVAKSLGNVRLEATGSSGFTSSAACALIFTAVAARALAVGRQSSVTRRAIGIGINGFGRIGRQVARIAMKDPETELKLINASYDADYLAYMMKYDTIHGKYDGTIEADGDSLVIDGHKVALSHTRDPAEIPFGDNGADYVCESTGVPDNREGQAAFGGWCEEGRVLCSCQG